MKLFRRSPRLSEGAGARLDEHLGRASPVIDRIRREYEGMSFEDGAWDTSSSQILGDDELALSILVAIVASESLTPSDDFVSKLLGATSLTVTSSDSYVDSLVLNDLRSRLVRRKLPYKLVDVDLLTSLAESRAGASWLQIDRARVAMAAVERYATDHGTSELAEPLERLRRLVEREGSSSDWTSLAARLRKLAPAAEEELDLSVLAAKDPWAKKVRPVVERDYRGHGALLVHLGSATASRPTKKWLNEAETLLGGDGGTLVRFLLEATLDVESEEIGRQVWEGRTYVDMLWLSEPSAIVVRGCFWAAPLVEDDAWLVPVAGAIVDRGMREEEIKVVNAALYALGESPHEDAIALLSSLAARVKDRRFLKGVEKALEAAAAKRGLTRSQLRESLVPTFELGPDGSREIEVGDAVAKIRVESPGSATTAWTTAGGRAQKSAPAEIRESHAPELAALKTDVAEIRKELGAQKLRVEGLFADERVWSVEEWRRHYLEHPLVQAFARALVWRFDGTPAIPLSGDELLRADGSSGELATEAEVRLWHPIDEAPEDVAAWRQLIRERELVQPFKQAFREVYLLAPAEEQTETYSNRFAAHIVRYPQAYALMKQRGWSVVALGPYDNEGGRQWREFEAHGIRVEFWMEHADQDFAGMENIAELAATDQVRFYRRGEDEPMRLAEVPGVVFSEAMRDVDLFVGVASIAADPEWIDHGDDRYNAYWREASFGELGQSALVRREALEALLPSLRIADRCSLEDRYLVVRGERRTYRIHLGSANVLMEPNDQYLCIVPARGSRLQKLYLPFPEDERFSVILSKAFLLVDDARITDHTILAQIEGR
jgi:Domain of unknown function (DUF4132)